MGDNVNIKNVINIRERIMLSFFAMTIMHQLIVCLLSLVLYDLCYLLYGMSNCLCAECEAWHWCCSDGGPLESRMRILLFIRLVWVYH